MILRYIKTGQYVPGVPARDLDDDDVIRAAQKLGIDSDVLTEALCKHGVYQVVAPSVPQSTEVVETPQVPTEEPTEEKPKPKRRKIEPKGVN